MSDCGLGTSPGKVILLGEHSVVFGEPAIAAAIGRRLEVRIRRGEARQPSGDAKLEEAIGVGARELGLDAAGLSVEVRSDIPPACGLGSSAALSVALIRALADLAGLTPAADDVRRHASRVEDVFHGTASGADVATSWDGHIVWFERGDPARIERLRAGKPFDLVIALSGEVRSTAGPVGRLRQRYAARPELYGKFFRLAGDLVRAGRVALEGGDWETLGALMDAGQGLLNGFGVSTPILERMIGTARGAGALGAKLSGAGGGGAIIALAPERSSEVAEALRTAGFESFCTRIGAPIEEVKDAGSNRRSA
ncbi:MAG: mevalonate kinase [Candidatus Binatia bacterium]